MPFITTTLSTSVIASPLSLHTRAAPTLVQRQDSVAPSSTAAPPYCYPFQDPDQSNNGYCQCGPDGADGDFSFASGGDVCPYTSPAPASLTVSVASVAPTPTPSSCTTGTNPDSECWGALGLTEYINSWWEDNQGDCGDYDGFADCWYGLMTPYAPSTCSQLNTDPACTQPLWKDFSDEGDDAAKQFYVSWAVWNTQGFFLDLYNAIGGSSSRLSDDIGAIVLALDPPDTSTNPWEYVLLALSFGLSLYSEGSILLKAVLRSAPQSTTLSNKLLFPPHSIEGDFTAWADVSKEMSDFTTEWQSSIGEALPLLVNDVADFTALGDDSPITGDRPPLDGLDTQISQSLGAYMISAIINELGFVVSRAENLDVHAISTDGSVLWWDTGCGGGYDENGVCDSYYYDGTDTYGLTDPHNMKTSYADLFQTLLGGSHPLTTGELLFSEGLKCTQTCGSNGGCKPTVDDTDPARISSSNAPSCISQLRICTWTWDTFGPFEDGCANLPSNDAVLPAFGVNPCIGYDDSTSVPHVYLGGGILKDDAPGWWENEVVCNTDY